MKTRALSLALALAVCLGLTAPALAAENAPEEEGTDFSQYLTDNLPRQEELTLGGVPFYQLSLDEAVPHLPTPDGSTREPGVLFDGRATTTYGGYFHAPANEHWSYSVYARQLEDSGKLYSLEYYGGNGHTGEVRRFETELRGISTGDDMAEVLEKLGLTAEGAALVAEELSANKEDFDLNTGWTNRVNRDSDQDGGQNRMEFDSSSTVSYWTEDVAVWVRFFGRELDSVIMRLISADEYQPSLPFTDVPVDEYYAAPVAWAVARNITNGTSDDTFSPGQDCTQAQILTFLYRAAQGSGHAASAADMDSAVTWAREMGMIDGSFDGATFCTRATAVSYIWQALGKGSAPAAGFTDVPAGADYAAAVSWAVERGVTNGTSDTTFSPGTVCTRGQIVTFLYRAYH